MKVNISFLEEKDFEKFKIKVDAGVRYWQDSEINNIKDNDCEQCDKSPIMPCVEYVGKQNRYLRANDWRWRPIINLNNGKIENWEIGELPSI